MADSLIDLCTLNITVPLTEETKNIHTNCWIYFVPPTDIVDGFEDIYNDIGGLQCVRWAPYRKNYWYVKGISINVSNDEQTMTLELSPFPTIHDVDDLEQKQGATKTANTSTESTNTSLKPPSWLSEEDKEWAIKTVTEAIGNRTDELAIAKSIFHHFTNQVDYDYYPNLRHSTPKGNRKKAWAHGKLNCADGANILETLYLTANINARIKHASNHYIVKLTINGNTYWVDNHRSRGKGVFNDIWHSTTSDSEGNITNGEYING